VLGTTPRPSDSGERDSGTHWIGGRIGPRGGLDAVEKRKISCPSWESKPYRPGRNLSLYLLFSHELDIGIGRENFPSTLKVPVVLLGTVIPASISITVFPIPFSCLHCTCEYSDRVRLSLYWLEWLCGVKVGVTECIWQ
jgi:hypothetical protein